MGDIKLMTHDIDVNLLEIASFNIFKTNFATTSIYSYTRYAFVNLGFNYVYRYIYLLQKQIVNKAFIRDMM